MADDRADAILRRQSRLEGERANWESHWAEAAERVLPRQRDFQGAKRTGGEKQSERVFDSTAPLALEKFAAAMESMLTPRNQRWHELDVQQVDSENLPQAVKEYLYSVTSILFRLRYAPSANFASQAQENYIGLGAFGTAGLFVDEMLGIGLRYRAISLAELFIAENHQGVIDTVHRRFELTARQARQKWGDGLPDPIAKAAEREPDRKFEFVHAVQPNEEVMYGRRDWRGMKFGSCYIAVEGRKIVAEGGFRSFPYAVSRYVTAPREVYGRSPAMQVLADIKTVNEQQKTLLRTGQLVASPPLLLSDDASLTPFKMRPEALNYGALDANGMELVKPLQIGANLPITREMVQDSREVINDAFLINLFRILVEKGPAITATEAMQLAQEKGELLAPTMGRQQSEFLGPLIQRELDIASMAGLLPKMPPEMREMSGEVSVEYTSPLMRAQRAGEGAAILTTISQVGPLAAIDASIMRVFKGAETVRRLADINGMPPDLLHSPDELAAMDEAEAQQKQVEQMLQAAPLAAGAAADFAKAQSLTGAGGLAAPQIIQ
ncbi:MAG: phage head-tail adapter protein [Caulobacter sp.]|nr:phage head-tail adapter protein [Caulobacter sp.]